MDGLDIVFKALAHSTRRAILLRLALCETTVNALGKSFDVTPRVMSKHIGILEQAGLVARSRQGQLHLLQLVPDTLGSTKEWIDFIRRA
ncbi:ArsR/SmtB family transcription factor [Rhizorhabdus argentea]|uniref:ArsR/SmtB family transcription factor n=1 Tax=Rhizorhabdus argentea TaxID=1387174 RepID=UPI003BF5B6BF